MNKKLKYSAIAGIVALVFSLSSLRLAIVIWGIANIVFEWGFKTIGEKTKNKLLQFSAIAFIVWSVVITLMFLKLSPSGISLSSRILFYLYALYGIVGIAFGVALFGLEALLGKIVKATAILAILGSALIALSVLGDLPFDGFGTLLGNWGRAVMFPVCVLEIIILFKTAKLKEFK